MKKVFRSLAVLLCAVVFPSMMLFAEGTKQVMPNTNSKGQLCINKSRSNFAFYGAPDDLRLNISIASTSEKIRFGFGKDLGKYTPGLVYRIKNPAGTTVYGPFPVPTSGAGFISSYNEAVSGPFPAAGGYDYIELPPLLTTGDYFLEFEYPSPYSDDTRHLFDFFDITVVNAAQKAIDGRVWSKAWQFWSGSDNYSGIDRFYGKMMVLSDDSIVTQIDCNGFRGGTFSISSNMTGCNNTGNLESDRKSRSGPLNYLQYKIFLNDPDSSIYPTQKAKSGIYLPINVTPNCTTGGGDFGLKVEKDGTVKLLIEINPNPGADAEDVQIIADVKAYPGGDGYNHITWDGNDNYGKPVTNGTSLAFTVTNLSGLTHLPIFDIENNDYGYIVSQIRPAGGQLRIFWDDSEIGGTTNSSTGCISASGCHTWNSDFGNNKTINSWWFVSWSETTPITFLAKRAPEIPALSGNSVHCIGTAGSLDFYVANDPNSTSYTWSYSGKGVTINESGRNATLNFAPNATEGILSVKGQNAGCGYGPATDRDITFEPLPVVTLAPFHDLCYTAPGFKLTGGEPQGGNYFVDGNPADSLFPYKEPEGLHRIVYSYTSPTTCSNSDTTEILLYSGPECLGTVFFPNAFKPGNDSLNKVFRPVVRNISSFKMYIFDRWGQLIFTTDDVAKGWDGKFGGRDCPEGMYAYTATFGLSLREENIGSKKGLFSLIR